MINMECDFFFGISRVPFYCNFILGIRPVFSESKKLPQEGPCIFFQKTNELVGKLMD
jgi:hypothetical protein